jgi:hypothetical protein
MVEDAIGGKVVFGGVFVVDVNIEVRGVSANMVEVGSMVEVAGAVGVEINIQVGSPMKRRVAVLPL